MPRAIQMLFSSMKTSLPPVSCTFFWGWFIRIILDASSSEIKKLSSKRELFAFSRRLVTSPVTRAGYGQHSSAKRPLISS